MVPPLRLKLGSLDLGSSDHRIDQRTSGSADQRIISDQRTSGPSDHRIVGSADQRTSGPADHRIVGPSDHRNIGPLDRRISGSGPWTIGPSDQRITGPSDQVDHGIVGPSDHRIVGPSEQTPWRSWVRECGVLCILTCKCASRHNRVPFSPLCPNSYLRTRRFSEPTFRTSGTTNHWKNTAIRDVTNIWRAWNFFLLTLHACWSSC